MCKIIDTRGLGLDDFLADNGGEGWADIPNLSPSKSRHKKTSSDSDRLFSRIDSKTLPPKLSSVSVRVGKPAIVVKL